MESILLFGVSSFRQNSDDLDFPIFDITADPGEDGDYVDVPAPCRGVFRNLGIRQVSQATQAEPSDIILFVNDTPTALRVSIAPNENVTRFDDTHQIFVQQGDNIRMHIERHDYSPLGNYKVSGSIVFESLE